MDVPTQSSWPDRLRSAWSRFLAGPRWGPWVAGAALLTVFYTVLSPGNRSEVDDAYWILALTVVPAFLMLRRRFRHLIVYGATCSRRREHHPGGGQVR